MPIYSPETRSSNTKLVTGVHTTVAAVDTITIPGLRKVESIQVSLGENAALGLVSATAAPSSDGSQAVIKTWRATSATNPTPIATIIFGRSVTYFAAGY